MRRAWNRQIQNSNQTLTLIWNEKKLRVIAPIVDNDYIGEAHETIQSLLKTLRIDARVKFVFYIWLKNVCKWIKLIVDGDAGWRWTRTKRICSFISTWSSKTSWKYYKINNIYIVWNIKAKKMASLMRRVSTSKDTLVVFTSLPPPPAVKMVCFSRFKKLIIFKF